MTDLVPVEEPRVIDAAALAEMSDIARWALDAREAHAVARSLAKTSFVGQTMRGKPDEICGAILAGAEIGLQPMAALRSIDIIQGTPAMRAHTLRGLVLSQGHEVWVEESSEERAVVCGQRQGSEHVERSEWTIDRARRLALLKEDNWQKQPGVMLVARATAEVCRRVGADVLMGLPYAVEELDDDGRPAPARKRTAKRKAVPVEDPPLDVDDAELNEPADAEPAEGETAEIEAAG